METLKQNQAQSNTILRKAGDARPSPMKRLTLSRKYGERLKIGPFWVWVERKGSNNVKLHIDAPEDIEIFREELLTEMTE